MLINLCFASGGWEWGVECGVWSGVWSGETHPIAKENSHNPRETHRHKTPQSPQSPPNTYTKPSQNLHEIHIKPTQTPLTMHTNTHSSPPNGSNTRTRPRQDPQKTHKAHTNPPSNSHNRNSHESWKWPCMARGGGRCSVL